jgi:hypothetical protein
MKNNSIWDSILTLQGQSIYTLTKNKHNKIVKVDNYGLSRISSNNKISKINKEEIMRIVDFVISRNGATRKEIFDFNDRRRNSSIIIALLSQLDTFIYDEKTMKIKSIEII